MKSIFSLFTMVALACSVGHAADEKKDEKGADSKEPAKEKKITRDEQKKLDLEKYDVDKDGRLDSEEKAKIKEDKIKAKLEEKESRRKAKMAQ